MGKCLYIPPIRLGIAEPGQQIWVAKGTYHPVGNEYGHFEMKNGVAIYGGFAGNEEPEFDLSNRDFISNETILSGFPYNYHVFYHDNLQLDDALLDGFTITEGNADGNNSGAKGFDFYGGGMVNINSSPTLTNIIFSENRAYYGGGMYNDGSSNPTLINVTFNENYAKYFGGGMHNDDSSPTLTNVTFSGNRADYYGGGMYNVGSSNPKIVNSIFWGNTAGSDGVDYFNIPGCSSIISYSLIKGSGGSGVGWDDSLGIDGGGNIDADPLFIWQNGLRLHKGSPAIDAGTNATFDEDGVAYGVTTDFPCVLLVKLWAQRWTGMKQPVKLR